MLSVRLSTLVGEEEEEEARPPWARPGPALGPSATSFGDYKSRVSDYGLEGDDNVVLVAAAAAVADESLVGANVKPTRNSRHSHPYGRAPAHTPSRCPRRHAAALVHAENNQKQKYRAGHIK